jgi:cysteine synthase A
MTVITAADQFNVDDLFVDLLPLFGERLLLKCEGMNLAGSVKLKAAMSMLDDAERAGLLTTGGRLVESSSGNLGIALAVAAAGRGYGFTCVTDVRCNPVTVQLMRALGADVEVVDTPLTDGGYLAARIARVRQLRALHPGWVWLNQYENPANWRGHYASTGPEIVAALGHVDVLFVGAGTCGTLMGVTRYLQEHSPGTRVVGVDSAGSVTFGGPPGVRHVPGLGAGVRPPMLDAARLDDVVVVDEVDTVRACRAMAARGFLFGGSTGTVVAGAVGWLARHGRDVDVAVAISPDLGERYLDTVYDDAWALARYGDAALLPGLHRARDAAAPGGAPAPPWDAAPSPVAAPDLEPVVTPPVAPAAVVGTAPAV